MISTIPTEELIIYVLSALIILLILWVIRLEVKLGNLPAVKHNQAINNQIIALQRETGILNEFKEQTNLNVGKINDELKHTIQGIETIRFNPFKGDGIGGNQSFATTMIDQHGNGVVLSSLYSRDRVSTFAKPIVNWNCEHEMSEEEKEVLEKVKNNQLHK